MATLGSRGEWEGPSLYGYCSVSCIHKLMLIRDTFSVFLRQLQLLSSASVLSAMESQRVSALLGLVGQVFSLAAVDPSQLRLDHGGQLPAPAVQWSHAAGMFPPLLHALTVWARDSAASSQPNMVWGPM